MKRFVAWIDGTTNAIKTFTTGTYTQLRSAARLIASSANIKHPIKIGFVERWRGFSYAYNTSVVPAFVESSATFRSMLSSYKANIVLYMGMVLLYHKVMKPAMRMVDEDFEDSYAETAMDWMAWMYFWRLSLRMYGQNIVYPVIISKSLADSTKLKLFKPASVDEIAARQADLESLVLHGGKLLTAGAIRSIPFIGFIPAAKFDAHLYGQAIFEVILSDIPSLEERYDIMGKHQNFIEGLGWSYLLSSHLLKMMVYLTTGVSNPFIDQAIYAVTYQYYILTIGLMDKIAPDKEPGADLFFYTRMVVTDALKRLTDRAIATIQTQEAQIDLLDLKKQVQAFPPIAVGSQLLLPGDLRSFRRFARSPAGNLFFEVYGKEITNFIDYLIKTRGGFLVHVIPRRILSEKSRAMLKIILADRAGDILIAIKQFVIDARLKIPIEELDRRIKETAKPLSEFINIEPIELPLLEDIDEATESARLALVNQGYSKKILIPKSLWEESYLKRIKEEAPCSDDESIPFKEEQPPTPIQGQLDSEEEGSEERDFNFGSDSDGSSEERVSPITDWEFIEKFNSPQRKESHMQELDSSSSNKKLKTISFDLDKSDTVFDEEKKGNKSRFFQQTPIKTEETKSLAYQRSSKGYSCS